jgi:lysyl-tRNA synthetase class 2
MRPEKQVQVELEDDEKLIVSLLQANENKWNLDY